MLSILSAMHCNTASGLTALDLTALCLVAAAFRVPLQVSVEVAGLSLSNCCCDVSVSRGSPLSEGAPVRAIDACCHLRLMPLSACAPGAPASACSAQGQLLGQSPSAILLLSWMLSRCLGRPLGQAVISAGSVIALAAPVAAAGGASSCSLA